LEALTAGAPDRAAQAGFPAASTVAFHDQLPLAGAWPMRSRDHRAQDQASRRAFMPE